MEQTITKHDEQINKLANQIISNSKDAKWAKEMLSQLKGLLQMDKLIDVPLKDVTDKLDFGANVLYKVRDGYIWECKGGMTTHVSVRMSRVCAMLNTIFELHNKGDKTDDEQQLYNVFVDAVSYTMQCPIFSSLSEMALFENATNILQTFNKYGSEIINNAEPKEETTEDIKENIQAEKMANALEELINTPLPPEDAED